MINFHKLLAKFLHQLWQFNTLDSLKIGIELRIATPFNIIINAHDVGPSREELPEERRSR